MNINLNSSGAVLNLAAVSAGSAAFQNAITVNDNAAINVLASQAVTLGGTINLATAGKTLTLGGAANNTVFNTIISGPGALAIASPATVTLTAADTYTGGTTVNPGGTLLVGSDGINPGDAGPLGTVPNSPAVSLTLAGGTFKASGAYILNANRNINVSAASTIDNNGNNFTIAGAFTGSSTLTKLGSGNTLTLTGNSPAFTGAVTDSTGTLTLAAGASFNSAALTVNSTVNINGAWTATSTNQNTSTVNIGATGSLTTGGLVVANTGTAATMTVAPGGALSVTGGNLDVGYESNNTATTGTLDMTGVSNFTATVANVRVGVGGGSSAAAAQGTLRLATNNTITATAQFTVGDSAADGNAGTRLITLGTGTTTVYTPNFRIGYEKYGGTLQLQGATGNLNLAADANGGFVTEIDAGYNTVSGTGTAPVSDFNLTNGTLTANARMLVIGSKATGGTSGTSVGTMEIGNTGSFVTSGNSTTINGFNLAQTTTTLNALMMGSTVAPTATQVNGTGTSGTLTIGGGTYNVSDTSTTVSTISLGALTGLTTAGITYNSAGSLILNSGTMTVASASPIAILLGDRTGDTAATGTTSASGTLTINTGASLILGNVNGVTNTGGIAGSTSVTGNTTTTSTVNLSGGLLDMGGKTLGTAANPFTNFNVTAGTLQNLLEFNNGGLITKSGPGTLTLAGTNKYSGGTTITGGTVLMSAINVSGANITSSPVGTGPVTLSGGTLSADGTGRTLLNALNITANSGFGAAGTAALTIDGTLVSPNNVVTLSNTPTVNFGSNVTINSKVTGTSGLGLSGAGSLTLSNSANDFSGNVTTATKLTLLNNVPIAGSITVNAGGSLNGNGIISGGGTVNSNGVLTPHIGAAASTLTIRSGLTLADSSVANFLLGASSDVITGGNSGVLTLAAGAETINLSGTIATGQYHLFTGFNSVNMGSSFGSFHIGTTGVPNDVNVYTFALAADTHGIDLNVIAPNIWTGAADHAASNTTGTWNTTTANWSSASSLFAAHDIPRFDDLNNTSGIIAINVASSGVNPDGIIVASNTLSYTIDSTAASANGGISGTGGITKSGSSTLTLIGQNTFSGTNTIQAGTVSINRNSALGTGDIVLGDPSSAGTTSTAVLQYNTTGDVSSNRKFTFLSQGGPSTGGGTLDFNGHNATLSGTIIGSGQMTINADADINNNVTVTLTNPANALTGSVVINRGTLSTATAFGTPAVGASLTVGSALHSATFAQTAVAANLSSSLNLIIPSAANINVADSATTLAFTGTASGGALTKDGAGALTLTSSTLTGNLAVNNGSLSTNFFGPAANLSIGSALTPATLQYTGAAASPGGTLTIGAGGGTLSSANNLTLSGAVTGTGALTKSGSGSMVLTGQVALSNGASVSNGTLSLTNTSSATPNSITGALNVATGATLNAAGSGTTNSIGSASVTVATGGTLILNNPSAVGAAPTGSLAAYYAFDGSGIDKTGTQPVGTIQAGGSFTSATSKFGSGSLNLTTGNSYFQTKAGGVATGANWTFGTWFKGGHFTTAQQWATLIRGSAADHQIIIGDQANASNSNAAGSLGSFTTGAAGGTAPNNWLAGLNVTAPVYNITTALSDTAANWHQLTAVASGTTTTFYIDGTQIGVSNYKSTADIFAIGNYQSGGQLFADFLDETYIYNRALTSTEVGSLVNASAGGVAVTPSTFANNVTLAGTLNLGAYSALTGNLSLSSSPTITTNASGPSNISGPLTGTGATVTISGPSLLTLSNTSGTTTLDSSDTLNVAGTLQAVGQIGQANPLGTANLTLATGGTLALTSSSGAVTFDNPLSMTGNATISSGVQGGTLSTVTQLAGQAITLGSNSNGISIAPGKTLSLAVNDGTLTLAGPVSGAGSSIVLSGPSTVALSGASTYSGTTTVAATQTLRINSSGTSSANSAIGTSTLIINGGTIDNTSGGLVSLGTANAQTWGGDFTFTGSNALNLGSGPVSMSASGIITTTAGTLTVGGNISGSGFNLTKAGAGTLVLGGIASTYSGKTSIQNGTLSVASIGSVNVSGGLGDPTTLANGTIDLGATTTGAQLNYTGAGETTDRVINLAGTTGGAVIDSSASSVPLVFSSSFTATGAGIKTLTLQGSSTLNNAINGVIVDNTATNKTSVIKSGAGTWVLGNTNTYSGGTTINAGTLTANATTALGTGAITVNNGTLNANVASSLGTSVLTVNNGTVNSNFAGALGSGPVTINNGLVTSSVTGGLSSVAYAVNGGTLDVSHNGALTVTSLAGSSSVPSIVALGNNTNLIVNGSATTTFNGSITGTGTSALTISGTTNLTLGGSSTIAGGVTVNSGTTLVGAYNANTPLGTGTLSLNGGLFRSQTTITSAGFGTNGAGWSLNGGPTIAADVLTLTDAIGGEARSAWLNTKQSINGAFSEHFVYNNSGGAGGADGMAFVIQNASTTALGASGGGIGYSGITPSLAVLFGIYSGSGRPLGTYIDTNGAVNLNSFTQTGGINTQSATPIDVTVAYNGTTLTETLLQGGNTMTNSLVVNLPALLSSNTAYIGFTGATGGSNALQKITNASFSYLGSGTANFGNNVSVNSTSTIDVATGNASFGNLTFTSGTLNITSGTAAFANTTGGTISLGASPAAVGYVGSGAGTFTSTIQGAGGVNMIGSGSLTLSGPNTYTGNTTISSGSVIVGANSTVSTGNITGPLGNGIVALAGGNLSADTSNRTVLNQVNISASSSLGTAASTSVLTIDGTSVAKPVVLSNIPTLTINSPVTIASLTTGGDLIVDGTSPLTLTNGNNSYGNTTVNAGAMLLVANTTGVSATGGGTLTVNGAVGGTGTIGGPTVINGAITPHGVSSTPYASPLTFTNSLTLSPSSSLNFLLGDTIAGGGTGTLFLGAGSETLNLSGSLTSGSYHIFSGFDATNLNASTDISTLSVAGVSGITSATLSAVSGGIDLTIATPTLWTSAADAGTSTNPATWDSSKQNWTSGTGNSNFFTNGDAVYFDITHNTGSTGSNGLTNIATAATVKPSAITVAGGSSYAIASTAGNPITDPSGSQHTTITVMDGSSLQLTGLNTISGTIAIKNGTIDAHDSANANASLGTGTIALGDANDASTRGTLLYSGVISGSIANNLALNTTTTGGPNSGGGTIDFHSQSATFTSAASITGGGQLTIANGVNIDVSSATTANFHGSITLPQGNLIATGLGSGSTGANLTLAATGAATLTQTSSTSLSESRNVIVNSFGASVNVQNAATTYTLPGGVSGAGLLTKDGPGALNLTGLVSSTGGIALTSTGGSTNTLLLSGNTNTLTGTISIPTSATVQAGQVTQLLASGSLGTAAIALSGGTLNLQASGARAGVCLAIITTSPTPPSPLQ